MRCEKQHYHEIDTPSITLIHFQPKLHKEKWYGDKGKSLKKGVNVITCLSPFHNKNNKHRVKNRIKWIDKKKLSTNHMIGEECRKVSMINKHIPKCQT